MTGTERRSNVELHHLHCPLQSETSDNGQASAIPFRTGTPPPPSKVQTLPRTPHSVHGQLPLLSSPEIGGPEPHLAIQ